MKLALIMINKKFNNVICKRISTLRKEHNLTLEQLAYQSGISKGGLSENERNMKEPRAYTILRICSGLGITMKDFFDYNELDDFINSISYKKRSKDRFFINLLRILSSVCFCSGDVVFLKLLLQSV